MVFHPALLKITNIDRGSNLLRKMFIESYGLMVDQELKLIDHITCVNIKSLMDWQFSTRSRFVLARTCLNMRNVGEHATASHLLPLCLLQNRLVTILAYRTRKYQ